MFLSFFDNYEWTADACVLLPLVPLAANPKQDPTDPLSSRAFLFKYKSWGTTIQTLHLNLPTPEARQAIVQLEVSVVPADIPTIITIIITLITIRGNILLKLIHKKKSPARTSYRKDPYSSMNWMDLGLIYLAFASLAQGVPQFLSTRDWFLSQSSHSWETSKSSQWHKARTSQEKFYGKNLFFPNFCKTCTIPSTNVQMFDSPYSQYDNIIGRDILGHGFILDHAQNVITWDGLSVPIYESTTSTTSTSTTVTTNFSCPYTALTIYAASSQPILKAKYERSLPQDVVRICMHLSDSQQSDRLLLLNKFSKLFSG